MTPRAKVPVARRRKLAMAELLMGVAASYADIWIKGE